MTKTYWFFTGCYRFISPNQDRNFKRALFLIGWFMFSQMCTDERLSNKMLYPTFSRTIPPISGLVPPLHALMKHFNWTRVGLIAQTNQQWSQWSSLEKGLGERGLVVGIVWTMTFGVHYNTTSLLPEFEGLLQTTAKESRGRFRYLISEINSLFL